ncbi:uncharacterized protein N7515_007743 [Penicillium bovifimosum]|uniref:Uncharacterized protein n=1 Tax=Penicillium bovifimosum TaxID=126998 RepID=A0A9W9GLN5_9EURO|nr:uncharacterized protein N7515_007743 [Penicillium bovifimosum]KAJ5123918.1 hypothetical protein N7515_007743 [Penicillium bovifimosum]
MISTISSFFLCTREFESSPRDAAVEGARRLWNECIQHPSTVIERANYSGLHIKCSDLGGDQIAAKSRFFAPLGENVIPLPHLEDKDTLKTLEDQRKYRRSIKENPMAHDIGSQTQGLVNIIRVMFQVILRDTTQIASGKYLSLQSATGWQIREVVPFIINEQFLRSCVDPPVPAYAYVYNDGKPTGKFIHSHTIIALEICEEPGERLTRLEALAIIAVTITRLEGDNLPKRCKTVPVMVISTFGRMKARILTAHYESEELIIRKTPLLDFAEDGPAEANMALFMRCMASKAIDGPPVTPTTATYPGAPHNTPTSPLQDRVSMSSTTSQDGSEAIITSRIRNANESDTNGKRPTPIEVLYSWQDDLSD